MENILLAGGIIDFYVNRNRLESYKKDFSKRKYVQTELHRHLSKLKNIEVNGVTIRDASITSNNYWRDELNFIPDIGYCASNLVKDLPKDSDKVALRVFQVDLVGVTSKEDIDAPLFFKIKTEDFILTISSVRLV